MNDRELDRLLRRSPRGARLPADPWPAIDRSIDAPRQRLRAALGAALALLLFGGGVACGSLLFGGAGPVPPGVGAEASAFEAATRVQAAGSAYLAAVGALDRVAAERGADDALAVAQGYEAALAVVEALTYALHEAPVGNVPAERLSTEASRVRDSVGARVAALWAGDAR